MRAAGSFPTVAPSKKKVFGFAPSRRLKSARDYAETLRVPAGRSIRSGRHLVAMNSTWRAAGAESLSACPLRFGVTVGKRNVKRAVDRVLVKRILREACRHRAAALESCATRAGACVDIVLRIKSPLATVSGDALTMAQWRRQVRMEADNLLSQMLSELSHRLAAAAPAGAKDSTE